MAKITQIHAREVLDSRGNPTVEVEILEDNGQMERAIVPSGASTGTHEALELRDNDAKRFGGKGVLNACANVNNEIFAKFQGFELGRQSDFDQALIDLDGTSNKSRLGANAMLACSMAYARLSAKVQGLWLYEYFDAEARTLPIPMMNVINGGAHADSGLEFQEFMIVPIGFETFSDRLRAGAEIFHALKKLLSADGHSTSVGDEGGFAPKLSNNEDALKYLVKAITQAGYTPGEQVKISLDVAASEFCKDGKYMVGGVALNSQDLVTLYGKMASDYPIFSIEDGLAEDDFDGWIMLNAALGSKVKLVGDDFLVTNVERIKKAHELNACNAVLIKLNQIGTVTETLSAIAMTKSFGWDVVISHRSGETEDTFIADLAVGTGSEYIKTGSLSRTDRVAKYNQLLRIEERNRSEA